MATELIEPFERELRRNRRNDGFSADGLSYRVADDFGKLWGQALSEYETRTADPRYVAGAAQPEPDNPELLRRQLLDPLMQRFGSTRQDVVKQATPRTYKFGNRLVSVDPTSGATEEIFAAPEKEDTRGDSFERQIILGKLSDLRKLRNDRFELAKSGRTAQDIDAEIAALENQGRAIYQPAETRIAPPVPEAPKPQIYIGANDRLTPAPTASKPQDAPPKERRVRGDIYNTPKGVLKWTGTGWVMP